MTTTWTPPSADDRRPYPPPRQAARADPGLDRSDLERPPPSRVPWVVFGSLLVVGAVVMGTFNVTSLLAHGERVSTRTFPAAEITDIVIGTDTGSVQVAGADVDEVTVRAEISRGLRETGSSQTVEASTLRLDGSCPVVGNEWCSVNYTVEVPRDLDLVIDTDGGATVRNVDGTVNVFSDNGRVTLSSLSGAVDVDADNGRVEGTNLSSGTVVVDADNGRIELEFATAPEHVVTESDNGSVDIAVPRVEGGYAVESSTDNGSETIDVATDPAAVRRIRASSDNGSVTVRSTD